MKPPPTESGSRSRHALHGVGRLLPLLAALFAIAALGAQSTWHVDGRDPARTDGQGTRAKPWPSLDAALADARWKTVRPGDTVVIRGGVHAAVRVSGHFDPPIVVEGDERDPPRLVGLDVEDASGWIFRGLVFGPAPGEASGRRSLVVAGDRRPTHDVAFEDCFVRGGVDPATCSAEDWLALPNGMLAGRVSERIAFRRNYVGEIRNGITLTGPDSVAEGNVVANFSADGIRLTRPGCRAEYNVIKNAYCGREHGDGNHDDGIQCFAFPKRKGPPGEPPAGTAAGAARDTTTLRDCVVRKNLILNWEDDDQPLQATMQGIGFFDGPMYDFVVEDNVVCVSHWHGVSLYDAIGCRITGNTVFTRWTESRLRPWVMLGSKHGLARGNVVENNLAHSIKLGADAEVRSKQNGTVTEAAFRRALQQLTREIEQRLGERHALADRPRLEIRWKR